MKQIFSVSQLNSYIRRIFEGDYVLKRITIKGEVSNCKYHSSGHLYFSLKDESSAIRCIMFSGDRMRGLHFHLENGQQVTVTGRVSVFERDGLYQFYAREILAQGAGEQYLKLEKLKQELQEKGYFDFERKKELPGYPEKIGIVTALTGAAIEDIQSVALRRNPCIQLYLYPAKVQGEGAAASIARGIRFLDDFGVDIIIIGRGGGSAEDLWAFNERCVADAIFAAHTPIISGTGHEVDTTLADYCADLRAATPTAACELAMFDFYALLQQMDTYSEKLDRAIGQKLCAHREKAREYRRLLQAHQPGRTVARQRQQTAWFRERLRQSLLKKLQDSRHQYELYVNRLQALSPTARLRGGYVYARDEEGRPLTSVRTAKIGSSLYLTLRDGEIRAIPVEIQPTEE